MTSGLEAGQYDKLVCGRYRLCALHNDESNAQKEQAEAGQQQQKKERKEIKKEQIGSPEAPFAAG